jgi:hypothetical protein
MSYLFNNQELISSYTSHKSGKNPLPQTKRTVQLARTKVLSPQPLEEKELVDYARQ